jgi:type IV pilus assembly protein PilV
MRAPARIPRGFTLIEVLVALLVLSAGLLGIAAVALARLQVNRSALAQVQAALLAADLADRLRANRLPDDAYACGDPCRAESGGNPLAVTDLEEWLVAVASTLPEGRAAITHRPGEAGRPSGYVIRLDWVEAGHGGPATWQLQVER